MSYNPEGNELGEKDGQVPSTAKGLPDQFQGRYAHLVLHDEVVRKEFFSMRTIKPNLALDAAFEVYRKNNPQVERDLLARAVEQQESGVTRGNFKQIWTAYRTEMFGR